MHVGFSLFDGWEFSGITSFISGARSASVIRCRWG
jgi:hypothetical protein